MNAFAEHNVHFTGAFESGEIKPTGSLVDGFFLQTLPHPQAGVEYVGVGDGGAGPNSDLDTRVVSREYVGSEVVTPRRGEYFLRSAIYYDKDYSGFPGAAGNKSRSTIGMPNDSLKFDFDVEGYVGFSIYTPSNYKDETGVTDDRGSVVLLETNASVDSTFFTLSQYVDGPDGKAHWWFKYYINDRSVQEAGGEEIKIDLGPVGPDKGKWTDFVIRYRANPFATTTNPRNRNISGAANRTYSGNKGILQVWKAEGVEDLNGDRDLFLKVDRVNKPVGLVPQASERLRHSFRVYKYGWHFNPTDVAGPVWFGFDEIRQGLVMRDGTGYRDVHPTNLGCTDGCSGGVPLASEQPKPPGRFSATK